MDQLSIIVPCYNEEQTVELFYTEVEDGPVYARYSDRLSVCG